MDRFGITGLIIRDWTLWTEEIQKWIDWPTGTLCGVTDFVNYFPILLSLIWSASALVSIWKEWQEKARRRRSEARLPSFSILIPFYGDADAALRTALSVAQIRPAPDEILLINDGSPEGSVPLDRSLLPPGARVLELPRNVGKAEALNRGLRCIRSEIVVCMDADTRAHSMDWSGMLARFALCPDLGGITGKIWPESVRNLAQLLQAIDYLAVICMVKCAESLWGGLMTVSGAWVAYRRQAMIDCNGWSAKSSTEDIDLSWRLQAAGWKIAYDPHWTARVGMAATWKSLWLQRRRWSSGLGRALRDQAGGVFRHSSRHVPVAFMAFLSSLWIWLCLATLSAGAFISWKGTSFEWGDGSLLVRIVEWQFKHCSLYALIFVFQIAVAILVDRGTWKRYPLLILFSPLYPVYFWLILVTSFLAGFPRGMMRRDGGRWEPTAEIE